MIPGSINLLPAPRHCRRNFAANRADALANARAREMDDDWYSGRSPDWSKVTVPFLSAANWAGFGLHPRGNFEAFTQAASTQKWLEGHPGRHEEWFYLRYGMDLQKQFSTISSKVRPTAATEPRVWLNLRRPFSSNWELREENDWPLARTNWTALFLDAAAAALDWRAPTAAASTRPLVRTARASIGARRRWSARPRSPGQWR